MEYMDENGEEVHELKSKDRLSDDEAKQTVRQLLGNLAANQLLTMEKEKRDGYLRQLKEKWTDTN
ncbi:hypothetical protein [Sporomusa rhizae]|uniref:hypothetical protein n=1 Tax=Sporomusa rhizae TaxID=357999 RepID=UPI00352B082B